MPGTEDREWSLWALEQGGVCVLDPALAVDHDHSRDPLRACFECPGGSRNIVTTATTNPAVVSA